MNKPTLWNTKQVIDVILTDGRFAYIRRMAKNRLLFHHITRGVDQPPHELGFVIRMATVYADHLDGILVKHRFSSPRAKYDHIAALRGLLIKLAVGLEYELERRSVQ